MVHLSLIGQKALKEIEKNTKSNYAQEYFNTLRNSKPPYFVTDLNGVTQLVTAEDFSKEVVKIIVKNNKSFHRLSQHIPMKALKHLNNFLLQKDYYDKIHSLRWRIGDPIWKFIKVNKQEVIADIDKDYINEYVLRKIMFELFHSPYKRNKIFYPRKKDYELFRRGDITPIEHIKNVLTHFGINKVEAENLAQDLFNFYKDEFLVIDKDFMSILYSLQDKGHLAGVITDRLPLAMSVAFAKKDYLDKLYLPIVSSHIVTSQQKKLIEKPHRLMFEIFLNETENLFRISGKLKSGEKINPHDFVFIDDRKENLSGSTDIKKRRAGYVGAEGVGMRTILYEGYKKGLVKFIKDLKSLEEFKRSDKEIEIISKNFKVNY